MAPRHLSSLPDWCCTQTHTHTHTQTCTAENKHPLINFRTRQPKHASVHTISYTCPKTHTRTHIHNSQANTPHHLLSTADTPIHLSHLLSPVTLPGLEISKTSLTYFAFHHFLSTLNLSLFLPLLEVKIVAFLTSCQTKRRLYADRRLCDLVACWLAWWSNWPVRSAACSSTDCVPGWSQCEHAD